MQEGDIEKMVLNPTWKEVLLEMIASEKLDPWNIDINALSRAFLVRIKKLKELDLHAPANIILAAAILLKYKSLAIVPPPPFIAQDAAFEEGSAGIEAIPSIELVSRIPPKRPITLEDLMGEMEKAMTFDSREAPKPRTIEEVITLNAPDFDIEAEMDGIFQRVKAGADSEGWTTFSGLLSENSSDEIVHTLLPLLHLSQKKKVDLRQDEYFGEIFIKV